MNPRLALPHRPGRPPRRPPPPPPGGAPPRPPAPPTPPPPPPPPGPPPGGRAGRRRGLSHTLPPVTTSRQTLADRRTSPARQDTRRQP
ncbi:hypothetical protein [Achromobacter xylosoxidans]|uniref:hypothetical protein n=1 Tax=Alcaligenes xylosoxydans xylosoxydans TaxID=85698 RepID=UPI0023688E35|nr:hypothetical protein [Achromobacter xylosoxidans]MDD7992041.1 hypothetical protein [Achromobacter xylosoxidans]